MTILSSNDFMKKDNKKTDTMNENELQEFILILYILEIPKFFRIKDS